MAEQAAVPQWIFFNEEIVQALCTLSVNSDALDTHRQELLHQCTYHRITLFLRQLLSTIKTADTGFIICWLAHQPAHMRYLGPSRAKHLYLLRLHDTLEIFAFQAWWRVRTHLSALAVVLLVSLHVWFSNKPPGGWN